jgi:hypothetical protein
MSNKRRLTGYSGFRFDLPHLRLIESSITGDFDDLIKGVLTGLDRPYVVRGFNIVGATADLNANVRGMRLRVKDSVLLHPTATEPGSILVVPPDEPDFQLDTSNPRVIGDWVPGTNYVAIDYRRNIDNSTMDQTAGWSASEKTEIQKSVPIGYLMDFRVIITSTGFGNYLPLYTVEINSSEQITKVTNSKDSFWRLGKGGAVPNASYSYPWVTGIPLGGTSTRIEGPTTFSSSNISNEGNPWGRGDWGITNFKENDDAIKTRLKEITGSPYWYADGNFTNGPGGPLTLMKTWWDANGSVQTSGGSVSLDIAITLQNAYTPNQYENSQTLLTSNINSTNPDWPIFVRATNLAQQFNVTQRASSGLTRTITTSVAHGIAANSRVVVSGVGPNYDGTFTVSVPSPTTLSYTGESTFTEVTTPSSGTVAKVQGRGEARFINYPILRVSQVTGAFSNGDNLEIRLSQVSTSIVRHGTVAVIDIENASVYGTSGSQGAFTVTNRQSSGVNRTLNIGTHSLTVGRPVRVAGVNANYDGIFEITAVGPTSITYQAGVSFTEASTPSSGNAYSGNQFIGTITGANESNFNISEGVLTIINNTPGSSQVAYIVQNNGATSESNTFTLNGLLATPSINSAPNSVTIGPLAWDQDIFIRGIIGGRQYKLSQSALAIGVGPGTSNASQFGAGTVNLTEEGQVAYLRLHRDLPLGTSTFNIANSIVSPAIIGATYTGSDGSTQTVQVGDYVKIDSDPENRWFEVSASNQLLDATGNVADAPNGINATGVKFLISKSNYNNIYVARRNSVPASSDVYWFAYREDRGSTPVVYLRQMELEAGEERQINDNQVTNLLKYTGANSESAINPNYDVSTPASAWEFESTVTVLAKEAFQNIVYLSAAPIYGIQEGDLLVDGNNVYTVAYPLDGSTFVTKENISSLTLGAGKTYRRPNKSMENTDNLTRAIRKLDRLIARFSTILNRPVYDESVFVQKITLVADTGNQNETIRSGYWVTTSGGGLAWVLAASNSSDANWTREVRHPDTGLIQDNMLLLHVIANPGGTQFNAGQTLLQAVPGATPATRQISAGLSSTKIWGDLNGVTGQIIKLPPNTRTGLGNNGTSSPTNGSIQPYAAYNAKPQKGGGELLVVANDTVRECGLDYLEDDTSSGPARFPGMGQYITNAAQIQILRQMPENTRFRFRNLATFGLPPVISPATFTLQTAYDGPGGGGSASGRIVNVVAGFPVQFQHPTGSTVVQRVAGRIEITNDSGTGIQPSADLSSQVGFSDKRWSEIWTSHQKISSFPTGQYPGAEWIQRTSGVSTSGAALQTAFILAIQDNRAYRIRASVVGRRTDVPGTAYASFTVEALVYRQGGGAVLAAAPVSIVIGQTPAASAYVATIDVNGNNARVRVGGDTGHIVEWVASVDYQSVEASS